MTAHAVARRPTGAFAALGVAFLACLALMPVEIGEAFDLPFHPLILHVPVVFNPLLAVVSIAVVARPAWRVRFGVPWAAFAVVCLAFTVLTVGAGEAFIEGRDQVGDTLRNHSEAAEFLRNLMFVFTAVVIGLVAVDAFGGPRAVATVLSVLVVLGALGTGFFTVRTGHLGAQAAWGENGP